MASTWVCLCLLAVVSSSAAWQITGKCGAKPEDRTDCGYPGIGREKCEAKGCCFDNSISGVIWCFPANCAVDVGDRTNCGYAGISQQECESRGCCYDDSKVGFWCFPGVTTNGCDRPFHSNLWTTKKQEYTRVWTVDMTEKEAAFIFSVKICKNARLRLLTTTDLDSLGYNFNIDVMEGDNFATSINRRTGVQYEKSKVVKHGRKLNCDESRDFWVTWNYDTGRLAIGDGHDPNKNEYGYMIYTGDSKLNVRYAAIASGADNDMGVWKIYEQCPLPNKPEVDIVEPGCSATADCGVKDRCVDGKCEGCPKGTELDGEECKTVCISDDDCESDSACNTKKNMCNKCPEGTAPRYGNCDETCSATNACSKDNNACVDGFCEECGENQVVIDASCVSICDLKRNLGDCSTKVTRYFYKASTVQCNPFDSCEDADGNSFATKEECKDTCEPKPLPPECLLTKTPGNCEDYSRRYYYNKDVMKCKKFEFNGCDGNANNFLSKEDCRDFCAKYD